MFVLMTCRPSLNFGHDLVNTVEAAFFALAFSHVIRMFVLKIPRQNSNRVIFGLKTRSLGQIERKYC